MNFIKRIYKSFMRGPIYLILFGLIFFGVGGGLTYIQRTFEKKGIQVQGEVVGLVSSCDDDGCTYKPNVRFQTQYGQTISFTSTYSSSPPAYRVGEKVQVIYSSDNPDNAVIKGEGQLFRIIFMGVGGIIIAVGLGMFGTNVKNSYLE